MRFLVSLTAANAGFGNQKKINWYHNDVLASPLLRLVLLRRLNDCFTLSYIKGGLLVTDNDVFNGPLGCSLHLFDGTAHSTHSLCSALLCYAHLARSLYSRAHLLGRSLCSFSCTTHSPLSFYSAPLYYARLACSLHSWACSLTLLTPSRDSWNFWICIHAVNAFNGNKHIFGHM